MDSRKKKFSLAALIPQLVFMLFAVSAIYVIIRIFIAPTDFSEAADFEKVKSDYVLMLLQCALGMIALLFPKWLEHKWQITLPSSMLLLYVIFLYCAIFLGEVRSFYYKIPHWDTILHTFSGGMLGAIGFSIVSLLNANKNVRSHLSPVFVAMFAFCFAVTLGVFWELYEYASDAILGTNMQKFMLEDGTFLYGHEALSDTMMDFLVDVLGAFVVSLIGYFAIRKDSDWIDKFELKKR